MKKIYKSGKPCDDSEVKDLNFIYVAAYNCDAIQLLISFAYGEMPDANFRDANHGKVTNKQVWRVVMSGSNSYDFYSDSLEGLSSTIYNAINERLPEQEILNKFNKNNIYGKAYNLANLSKEEIMLSGAGKDKEPILIQEGMPYHDVTNERDYTYTDKGWEETAGSHVAHLDNELNTYDSAQLKVVRDVILEVAYEEEVKTRTDVTTWNEFLTDVYDYLTSGTSDIPNTVSTQQLIPVLSRLATHISKTPHNIDAVLGIVRSHFSSKHNNLTVDWLVTCCNAYIVHHKVYCNHVVRREVTYVVSGLVATFLNSFPKKNTYPDSEGFQLGIDKDGWSVEVPKGSKSVAAVIDKEVVEQIVKDTVRKEIPPGLLDEDF